MRYVLLASFLAACADEEPLAGPDPSPDQVARAVHPELYQTCPQGCIGWQPKGLPSCGKLAEGDRCSADSLGKECDPHDPCNSTLVCADSDPLAGSACPI